MLHTHNHIELSDFSQNFFSLSKTQKKIFRYLHWFCSTYERVQPSQEHIANHVGCDRRTVIRAVKKFIEFGWFGAAKAFWKTCTYFMADWLKGIDLSKLSWKILPSKESHFAQNVTENVTPIKELPKDIRNVRDGVQNPRILEEKTLPHEVKDLPIQQKDKILLAKYSLQVLRLAIEDAKTYSRRYNIRNIAAFITSRCKVYAKKSWKTERRIGA